MIQLYNPKLPCNVKKRGINQVHSLDRKLDVVQCSEGYAVFGKESCWIDETELRKLRLQHDTRVFSFTQKFLGGRWFFYSPIDIEIELLKKCNQRCVHCKNESSPESNVQLNLGVAKEVLREFRKRGGQKLIITGGEPTLYQHLEELLAATKDYGIRYVEMTSNGSRIDKTTARLFAEYLNRINLSVHGDEQTHESVTQTPGSFRKAMSSIDSIKECGLETVICFTIMRENIGNIRAIFDIAKRTGARTRFNSVMKLGRGRGLAALSPDYKEFVKKQIASESKRTGVIVEEGEFYAGESKRRVYESKFYGCNALRSFAYIDSSGNLYPCALINVPAGNVNRNSLQEIWYGVEARKAREEMLCESRSSCEILCGGLCKFNPEDDKRN